MRNQWEIMTPTSLIIVADRGSLKAYKVSDTPTRGASLQLIQAFDLADAHGRYEDKVTDQAGRRFGVADATGGHTASIAEHTALEQETDKRICKQLAGQIADIVRREAGEGWSFAAPTAIYSAVLRLLPAEVQNRIVEHVKSDLVKIEPAKLTSHFRSLQPL